MEAASAALRAAVLDRTVGTIPLLVTVWGIAEGLYRICAQVSATRRARVSSHARSLARFHRAASTVSGR
jgi:hypothetical protein